jgi:hypothetical protein
MRSVNTKTEKNQDLPEGQGSEIYSISKSAIEKLK